MRGVFKDMEAITVSFTPLQAIFSLALQIWFIAFPIILIRKINYLTDIVEEQFDQNKESS